MESELAIPTNDGNKIYGTLNQAREDNEKLIILVHGLADDRHHRIVFNASRYFNKEGFDTFRPSLYSAENDSRRLENCTIGTFVEDLNSVIYEFEDNYNDVYLACHSLGFVALDCDLNSIKGLVLWDPSLSLEKDRIQNIEYKEEIDSYLINWGVTFLIGEQLKIDWENINDERMLKNLDTPVKVIAAGKNDLRKAWEQNLSHIEQEYSYTVVGDASHGFTEEGVQEKLFSETIDWIKPR